MRKLLIALVLGLSTLAASAQTHVFPAEDTNNVFTGTNAFAQINNTLYVGTGTYATPQLAMTQACTLSGNSTVNVPVGTADGIDLSTLTGCSRVHIVDERGILPVYYVYTSPGVYTIQPYGGGGSSLPTPALPNQTVFVNNTGDGLLTVSSTVLNALTFNGADVGAKINAAYAALPASGGTIQVSTPSGGLFFTTPIVFGSPSKPAILQCTNNQGQNPVGSQSALIFSPTSGVALTINTGTNGTQTFPVGQGVTGCYFEGNGGTSTGILLGGSNGAFGVNLSGNTLFNFGTQLAIGSNTWGLNATNNVFQTSTGQVLLSIPNGIANTGESMNFYDNKFFGGTVSILWGFGNYNFFGGSFDSSLVTANGVLNMYGVHFENPDQTNVGVPWLTVTGYADLNSLDFNQDKTSGTFNSAFIAVATTSNASLENIKVFSSIPFTSVVSVTGAACLNYDSRTESQILNADAFISGTTSCYAFMRTEHNTFSASDGQYPLVINTLDSGGVLQLPYEKAGVIKEITGYSSDANPYFIFDTVSNQQILLSYADGHINVYTGFTIAGNLPCLQSGVDCITTGSVGTQGQVQARGATANSFQATSCTDNGSTYTCTEPLSSPSLTLTGSGAPITMAETTTFSGVSGSTVFQDLSSNHRPQFNPNAAGWFNIPGVATAGTSAHLAVFTSNGIDLTDGGPVLSLTTTGTSGAATYISGVLNVPNYASGGGSGTVTAFSSGNLSPLFTTSVATSTTTPALSFSLSTQSANLLFAGPASGSAAAPTFRSLVVADIPTAIPIANIGTAGLSGTSPITISAGGAIGCSTCNTSSATVSSFSSASIASLFTAAVATATTTPALTWTLTSAAAGDVPNSTSSSAAAWTPTPILGIDGSVAGTQQYANGSASAHTIIGSAATTSNTVKWFATAPTTGDLTECITASTTCTMTDSGVLAANVLVATSHPSAGILRVAGSTQTATSAEISGDCTTSGSNAITCTKTNGTSLTGYATAAYVADTTITVGSGVAFSANTCSSYTGTGGTASTTTMTGLTSAMVLTHTATSDVHSVTGWSPASGGQLYFTSWPTSNTLNDYVCNATGSTITTGSSVTFNVGVK